MDWSNWSALNSRRATSGLVVFWEGWCVESYGLPFVVCG